ncbi:MAG: hypothetical protein Q8N76_02270 [Candidatus Omnitrophota bacterium]|nr:hypothetical protein [Candidatus Omnitrophota bacterium]
MKMLNLILIFVFMISFAVAGCQQPVAPKAKTSTEAASVTNNVSKPIAEVSHVAPEPAVPVSQTVQQPAVPVNLPPQEPAVSASQVIQQPAASVTKTAGKSAGTKIFTGKVDSVSVSNETNGTSSHILVVDDKGQLWIFTVKSYTPITAADGKTLTLDKIKKDNKVNIEYKGVKSEINESLVIHEAQSVKLIE